MPSEIFTSKPKAVQASREEALKRGCNGVTKYWYSIADLTAKTEQTRAEYAQEYGIPETVVDPETEEVVPNATYTEIPETVEVNQAVLVVDGNFSPAKEEGVNFVTISKTYAETEAMPAQFIQSRGAIPGLEAPTILEYLQAAGINYSKIASANLELEPAQRTFELVYDPEAEYNLVAIPINNLSFLKGEVASFFSLGAGYEPPFGTVWAYDEFMRMLKEKRFPDE